jgi:hypothetical protein
MEAVHSLAATGTSVLPWNQTLTVLGITAITVLLIGLVVIVGRRSAASKDADQSIVRSWIALALVAGLLLFCALTFAVNDPDLQNTVFGGLIASVGAAVAFYFSSKSADQARQDILNATFGTETVPDLTGLTEDQATALLGKTSLRLEVSPPSLTAADATVASQQPPKDSVVRKGSSVVITLAVPPGPPASAN